MKCQATTAQIESKYIHFDCKQKCNQYKGDKIFSPATSRILSLYIVFFCLFNERHLLGFEKANVGGVFFLGAGVFVSWTTRSDSRFWSVLFLVEISFFVAPPRYCWDSTKQVPVAQIKTLLHHEAHNKLMCICVW